MKDTYTAEKWLASLEANVWPQDVPKPRTSLKEYDEGVTSPHSAILGARQILKALLGKGVV